MRNFIKLILSFLKKGGNKEPTTLQQTAYRLRAEGIPRFRSITTVDKTPNNSDIQDTEFIVVEYKRKKYWALFKCPCGCGHVISLSLQKQHRPHWTFRSSRGRPSLIPSIWQNTGCKSHFFVTNGSIKWCSDYNDERY